MIKIKGGDVLQSCSGCGKLYLIREMPAFDKFYCGIGECKQPESALIHKGTLYEI